MKVKLTSKWMGHAAGTELDCDEETAAKILKDKAGQEIAEEDEDEEDAGKGKGKKSFDQAAVIKSASDAAVKAIEAQLADKTSAVSKMIHIDTVKDNSDADPTFGYLPGNTKTIKQLSKDEVNYAFGKFAKDVASCANGGHESESLIKCRERSRNMVTKAAGDGMVVGSDQEGGYLIFSAASQMLATATLENAVVRPAANRVTMSTQLLQLPYLRDETHVSGYVYGGIATYFDDELSQYTESKPKLGRLEFKLKKLTALGFASDEWIKWSPVTLGSWLIPRFGEAIAWKEDLVFLNGKGGGQPLGILNSGAAISISGEPNQDASSFVLKNTTKMFARLRVTRDSAVVWLMNRNVFPQLPQMNVVVGTAGAPVFTTGLSNTAQDKPGQALWGYPIRYTEKIPALGTAGCVTLTDLSDYTIADDQTGPEIAQSIHLKFDYGQTAFRLTKYIDGQNVTPVAFQPLYGDTLSPVVKLAAI